jgi:predicted ATPase
VNYLGEFTAARAHFEQGIALYDPQQHRSHAFRYGQDPGVVCRAYAGMTLWCLGYPDQALRWSREALTLARELEQPFSLVYALFFAAMLHQFRREGHAVQERAETVIALSAEQGFPHWLTMGTILRGWMLAERGEEGTAQIHQDLAAWRAVGTEAARPYFLDTMCDNHSPGGV